MGEQQTIFLIDFYGYGEEAGKSWKKHQESISLERIAAEVQQHTYHLLRSQIPRELVAAWEHGFWHGVEKGT